MAPSSFSGRDARSSASAAIEYVRIAGCVFAVAFSSSSGPSKQRREREKPSARSASSKTARAGADRSKSFLPIPTN